MITRRAKAFYYICENIPITIRPEELVVGSATKAPRGCQGLHFVIKKLSPLIA